MQQIIEILKEKYHPLAMIVYGSYADGTHGEDSDFDCLIVSRTGSVSHDTSPVCGVRLDAFIYSPTELTGEINPFDFVQIENGIIVMDTDGIAEALMSTVRTYLDSLPAPSRGELLTSLAWCEKMALRCTRADAEGYFRWHWLLCDSLEIYCQLMGRRYLGPKKSLSNMLKSDPGGYALYLAALQKFTKKALNEWLRYLREIAGRLL